MSRKNLNVIKKIPNLLKYKLKNKKINLIYKEFNKNLSIKENFIVADIESFIIESRLMSNIRI